MFLYLFSFLMLGKYFPEIFCVPPPPALQFKHWSGHIQKLRNATQFIMTTKVKIQAHPRDFREDPLIPKITEGRLEQEERLQTLYIQIYIDLGYDAWPCHAGPSLEASSNSVQQLESSSQQCISPGFELSMYQMVGDV